MIAVFKNYCFGILILIVIPLSCLNAQGIKVKWGQDLALTDFNRSSWSPRVVSWEDAVHVVWKSNSEFWFERIFIRSSFNRGETWNDQVRISPWAPEEVVFDVTPAVAVWEDSLYVVFREQNDATLFTGTAFSASFNSGMTWYDPPLEFIEDGWHPSVSVWSNYINVVDMRSGNVIHRLSTDGGMTFQPQDTLADIGYCGQSCHLRAYENYVLLTYPAWWDSTNTAEVFFQLSTDYGQTFEPYVMLSTEGMDHSQIPSMDITENGDVYVIWMDYKYSPFLTTGDVLMRHSSDFGEHWDDEVQVTFHHYASTNSVAAEGSQVHVVWEDGRWGNFSEEELYYCYSTDWGQNWSNEVRLTNAPHKSYHPDLCQEGDTLHVVWYDDRDGLWYQIYYKRGIIKSPLCIYPQFDGEQKQSIASELNHTVPAILMLTANPNPFNAFTMISLILADRSDISLKIYSISGREVIALYKGLLDSGVHQFKWEGFNNKRIPVSTGIYFAVLQVDGRLESCQKVVLLR